MWTGTIETVLRVIVKALESFYKSFYKKDYARSILMFHKDVFKNLKKINQQIEKEFEGVYIGKFLVVWEFLTFFISIGVVIILKRNLDTNDVNIIAISFLLIILIIFSLKQREKIISTIFNVLIPTGILGLLLLYRLNNAILHSSSSEYSSYILALFAFLAFLLEGLWLLMVSRIPLITNGRELDILSQEDSIKSPTFGLLLTLLISAMILVLWTWTLSQSNKLYWYYLTAALGGILVIAYIISDIKETAIRLLWKAKVPEFADSLPHIIVKTKTGNIFFGQLYDPLDDKTLILRNAKLVLHNGKVIRSQLEKVISHIDLKKQGNYISIPWDEIETLQIVEEGLYKPPRTNSSASKNKKSPEGQNRKIRTLTRCIKECMFSKFSKKKDSLSNTEQETNQLN